MASARRIFLLRPAGAAGAAALVPHGHAADPAQRKTPGKPTAGHGAAADAKPEPTRPTYLFFNAAEAAFIEAAVERLIPPDAVGPSAVEAGVPNYLDKQLAGAWGAGERLYRSGPWQTGSPSQGYQLPFTPAELFRTALRAIRDDLQQTRGTSFEKLDGRARDEYLTALENGTQELDGIPAKTFFESLLAMTIEGYFSDPVYGGNRDMAAWRMIGFPGAYGAYYETVGRHGLRYEAPPRSLAQGHDGSAHAMPDVSASAETHAQHGKGR